MSRNSVDQWDTNADNNSDIAGINIAEGCPPSSLNDAIRTVMAQIAAWYATLTTTIAGLMPKSGGTFTGTISGTSATFSGAVVGSSFSASGDATISGTISAAGNIVGAAIYTDGLTNTIGYASLNPGSATTTGAVELRNKLGVRQGIIGGGTTGGAIPYGCDNGAGHSFTGGPLNSVSGVQWNGVSVWYPGNFDPSLYPLKTQFTLSGTTAGWQETLSTGRIKKGGFVTASGVPGSPQAIAFFGGAFPNQLLGIQLTPSVAGSTTAAAWTDSEGASGFNLRCSIASIGVYYEAIGY